MTIVAISRELGSGGNTIAAAVAKALNFEYVEREIILQAAHTYGVPEAKLADVAEHRLTLWGSFDEQRRRYLVFLEAAYYSFAEKGNLVTASRGGPFFVRNVSHALRVRIMAPFEARVRRLQERGGWTRRRLQRRSAPMIGNSPGASTTCSGWTGPFPKTTTSCSTPGTVPGISTRISS
jgi:cytidylate kinase